MSKTSIRAALISMLIFTSWTSVIAQGFLKADGKRIVDEKGENVLLRGFGLGGWMLQEGYMLRVNGEGQQHKIRARIQELIGEESTKNFYNAWLSNHTRKIDIDSLKAWGFNSVRLPMHFDLYTLPIEKEPVAGKNTWLEKGFAMTDSLLAWCKANQLYLILDLHAAPGGQGNDFNISDRNPTLPSLWDSEANKEKTIALWRELAKRYVNEPWIGAYDLINEPNWGFEDPVNDKNGLKEKTNAPLRDLLVRITSAIREVDTKHIIIIEGNGWGNNYSNMLPQWDNNTVLSFHKYWNYNNQASVQHIVDTREKYNVPVWLGETGENSNHWFTEAIALLERNNIGWAWWPLKKLGFNNPLEIPLNPGYSKVLLYWQGKGPKPQQYEAAAAFHQLSEALKLENNIFHRDVVDAMMRQPHSKVTKPFVANAVGEKGLINLVDFDLGRNGYAYYDLDTANYYISGGPRGGNNGRNYRNDGVDIFLDSATMNSFYVGDIQKGEWLQYTVNVLRKGNYNLDITGLADKPGEFSLFLNGKVVSEKIIIPASKSWKTVKLNNVPFESGKNVIRIVSKSDGVKLKTLTLTRSK
jgi:endoglucanase